MSPNCTYTHRTPGSAERAERVHIPDNGSPLTAFSFCVALFALLPFDVFADHGFTDGANRTGVVAPTPEGRQPRFEERELLAQRVRREALQPVDDFSNADRG